jgi:NhaC family Na+:H+ antiporter
MDRPHPPQPLTLTEAIIPLAALALLMGLSYYLYGDAGIGGPNQVALAVAAMVAALIGRIRGHTLAQLSDAAVHSVSTGLGAIFILFAVGALIGTWAMSGTLVAMVYYGMKLLNPSYFYATAALICAVVSFAIGTSWTTVGTVGVGLMGIALSMEIDPAITAGAVISGSYFGDKASPLSDTANLVASTAGADLYAHIRETLITSGVSIIITLAVFWMMSSPRVFNAATKMDAINEVFHVTPWLFLPLAVVVILALCKIRPFTAIFVGAVAGGLVAVIVAPDRVAEFAAQEGRDTHGALAQLKGVWFAMAHGFNMQTGVETVDILVNRGGMESMLDTVWLVIAALAYGGVIEKIGVIERLISPVVAAAKSAGALVASVVGAVIATNIVTADQYMAGVLPARMFKQAFEKRGYAPTVMSRAIGDSATPTGALIPWNSCGAFMAATLGVATFDYLPYAIFNFTAPVLTILFAVFGIRMARTAVADHPAAPATVDP